MTRPKANALLMLTALLWGIGNVAQKTILEDLGPFTSFGLRCAVAVLVIAPLACREARAGRPMTRPGRQAVARAAVFFTLALGVQQVGYGGTSVTNASFLVNSTVVFTPFFAAAMLRQRPGAMTWPAVALVLAGVLLMGEAWSGLGWGDLCCLVAAVLYAVWIVMVARAAELQHRPFALAMSQFGLAAVIGTVIGAASEPVGFAALGGAAPELVVLGVLSTAAAFTLQAMAQAATPVTDAAIILSGESLCGALMAAAWLDERVTVAGGVGGVLILSAILLVQLPLPRVVPLRQTP